MYWPGYLSGSVTPIGIESSWESCQRNPLMISAYRLPELNQYRTTQEVEGGLNWLKIKVCKGRIKADFIGDLLQLSTAEYDVAQNWDTRQWTLDPCKWIRACFWSIGSKYHKECCSKLSRQQLSVTIILEFQSSPSSCGRHWQGERRQYILQVIIPHVGRAT